MEQGPAAGPEMGMTTRSGRTFLLGVGAQKAGSTWIHSYLQADPTVDFGPIKEYHVWDALHLPEMAYFDTRHRGSLRNTAESMLRKALKKGPDNDGIRGRLQQSRARYLDFFERLLDGGSTRVTGDITPSYSGLPAPVIAALRDDLKARDLDMKIVFSMRDPVARCISAAQMNRRKGTDTEGVPLTGDLDSAVKVYARSPEARLRADYRRTIETIRSVLPEDKIFFGFYETLFTEPEIARLSDFVGVVTRFDMAGARVNSHAKTETVCDETRAELREILRDTYEFCAAAFPVTRVLWLP